MSEQEPIRLYITHEFSEGEDYLRVFEYLESRDHFFYVNCSQPDARPDGGSAEAQQDELRNQIKRAEAVICPAPRDELSPLVKFQLTVAQAFNIPIVAINAFGGTAPMPEELREAADAIVDWNDRQITDSVRQTARGEDSSTWDVIDFDPDEFS